MNNSTHSILIPLTEEEKLIENTINSLTRDLYNLFSLRKQLTKELQSLNFHSSVVQKELSKQESLLKDLRGEVKKSTHSIHSTYPIQIPLTAQPSKAKLTTLIARMDLESRQQLIDQLSQLYSNQLNPEF